jgi:tetratricopeptide (TPR) repeat protein
MSLIVRRLFPGVVLLVRLLSAVAHAAAPSSSTLDEAEAGKWREDLRYLAQEMPEQHKNLFHTMTRQQFDDAVRELDERIPSLARHQIIVELARIVAMVGDGHTLINLVLDPKIGFRYYPLALYLFKDGLFVYAADRQYAAGVGGRVVKIGDVPAEQALSAVQDLISRDNEMGLRDHAPLLLATPEVLQATGIIHDMESAPFTVEHEGRQIVLELKPMPAPRPSGDNWALGRNFSRLPTWIDARENAETPAPLSLWLRDPQDYFWLEYLEDSRTVYVQYNGIADKETETIADFARRVFTFVGSHPVDRFVLDLRWNFGGDNTLNKPVLLGIIKSNEIDQRGKLFAVIGRRTFSAAQSLVNELEKYTNVTFVGEPTATHPNFYADAARIVLPNSGIAVRASTLWWQDMDPRDTREWTGPHVAVELASEDYRTGSDPVMRAILTYVPKKDLTEILMEALSANDVVSAVALYREFKADPTNAYVGTESSLNNLGYQLMGLKRYEHAIAIFELNVESYPRSANAHDSLAEAYMTNGNKELAVEHYKRSLELNPANANAVEMLGKLDAK